MAAITLTSEFTSNQDIDYKVEIIDNSLGSNSGETFIVSDFVLNYTAETDAPTGQIIASNLEIIGYNEGGYFNNTFLPALMLNQQNRFIVKLYKDTGSGYSLQWFGWIIQDITQDLEASQPRPFSVTAVDGLAMLSGKQYTNANSDAFQTTPIHKHIISALANNNLTSAVGASGDWLVTSVDWWEDSMTYGATVDPLTLTFLDVRVYNIFNIYWEREYTDCLTVLKNLCVTFGARLYLAEGAYRFEQYNEREDTTFREVAYRYNYTQNSTTDSASKEKAVSANDSLTSSRARDNVFSYLPAIKRCEINYEKLFLSRNFGQFNFDQTSATAQSIGYVEVVDDAGLAITIDYWGLASGNLSNLKLLRFEFEVTLTCTTTAGTVYYYNENDGGTWTTTNSKYEFYSVQKRIYLNFERISGTFEMLTTELPVDGSLAITVNLKAVQEKDRTSPNWTTITPTTTKWTAACTVQIEDGEFADESEIFYSTSSNTAIGDNQILKLGTTNVGDGLLQTGALWVKSAGTSGTISRSEAWRKGNSGTYKRILDLACVSAQSYYHVPMKIYDGDLYYPESFAYRINFDSTYFLPLNCSFSCNSGVWSGRWFAIDSDPADISEQTKLIKRKRLFSRPTANINTGEIPDGIIGGVQIEQGVGQIEDSLDYEIDAALMVTGVTGATLVPAQGAGTYIVPTKVLLVKTGGSIDYGSGNASIYFLSETTTVINSAQFLTAINTGLTKQFNNTDDVSMFENEALLINIGSSPTGGHEYTLRIYYKVINL